LVDPPPSSQTLIARKIGQVLNARAPKIVNGPEVLDKYVGGSEEKIRELFADAEKEMVRHPPLLAALSVPSDPTLHSAAGDGR
jgi:SpoVK/Ycf46/Vps4 family AAA+-type ATPase